MLLPELVHLPQNAREPWCSSSLLWNILLQDWSKTGIMPCARSSLIAQAKGGQVPSFLKWRLLLLYCPSHPSKDTPDTRRVTAGCSAPMVLLITPLIDLFLLHHVTHHTDTVRDRSGWCIQPHSSSCSSIKNHLSVDPSLGPCLMFHTVQENCNSRSYCRANIHCYLVLMTQLWEGKICFLQELQQLPALGCLHWFYVS